MTDSAPSVHRLREDLIHTDPLLDCLLDLLNAENEVCAARRTLANAQTDLSSPKRTTMPPPAR